VSVTNSKNKSVLPRNLDRTDRIFTEHGTFIRSAIRFHINSEAECDDLFQDLFVSLVANPIPEDVVNIRGFLYRVVTARAKDAFRRATRYRANLCNYTERCQSPAEKNPVSTIIEMEEVERIFDLIRNRLPRNEARALSLRYWHDSDNKEVAESMGVKTATVSRYICTGMKKIRRILNVERGPL
jgi:RNA polymerase sigma factor (sigma-70 family)